MKSNKLIALGIITLTALIPLRLAFFNEDSSMMGFKILMMIATMAGSVAAVVIGCDKSHA